MFIIVIRGLAKLIHSRHGRTVFNGEDQIENALDACLVTIECGDRLAARHHQDAVGMLDDLLQIGRDQNDSIPSSLRLRMVWKISSWRQVDAAGRLIEQKNADAGAATCR